MSEFTPEEYEAVVASVIASQALAGIMVTRAEVDAIWDEIKDGPLPVLVDVGEEPAE